MPNSGNQILGLAKPSQALGQLFNASKTGASMPNYFLHPLNLSRRRFHEPNGLRMAIVRFLSNISKRLISDPGKYVRIGSVSIRLNSASNPELVPAKYGGSEFRPPAVIAPHLKWLLQKEILGQDVFLIGIPGALRTSIVLHYLELCNREYEYLAITRDTTEADIKQRREIRSGTAFYTDLCAVRAALNGRVLVIDGVEKAERNVLPILNNLLENREMQLDDGRFLMQPDKYDKLAENYTENALRDMGIERVSERFHVIALGLPVPRFHGNALDPPLRSRFQCRKIPEPSFEVWQAIFDRRVFSLFKYVVNGSIGNQVFQSVYRHSKAVAPNLPSTSVNDLLSLVYAINSQCDLGLKLVPIEKIERVLRIWNIDPSYSTLDVFEMIYPYKSMFKDHYIKITQDFIKKFISQKIASQKPNAFISRVHSLGKDTRKVEISIERQGASHTFTTDVNGSISTERRSFIPTTQQETLLVDLAIAHSQGDFALLGPKGAGKTKLITELANRLGLTIETMVLYQLPDHLMKDMNARELLQRRRMLDNGDTLWEDSQLVAAAKRGDICILDGAEKQRGCGNASVTFSFAQGKWLNTEVRRCILATPVKQSVLLFIGSFLVIRSNRRFTCKGDLKNF
ncbi:aspartate carbamoyltransferase regulatory chain, allosteric domain protein [Dictyocaulus viviparus]|uniref:Aspartate carbamoyltransferase regulatory chain, allosteric domain protein n=1 Tax=Dictyocaulus viviparus TaxID=29172 RepID=A0A0D8XJ36_DICVI|nr:aspartate carbamoyltransferase regulatory chain, allosteric domain protein [Dictyocaulus viviparus]